MSSNLGKIGLILLAAGESARMGRPKQLLKFHGESLLRRAARIAVNSKCDSVVVVLGESSADFKRELYGLDVEVVYNKTPASGMAGSIRAGLKRFLEFDAVIIMVCDQPFVDENILDELIAKYSETKPLIVAAKYEETFGVPAIFGRESFHELENLTGKNGAKSIIKKHRSNAAFLDFPGGAIDIDTPEQFAKLI